MKTGTIKKQHNCGYSRYLIAVPHFDPGPNQTDRGGWECIGDTVGTMRHILDLWGVDDMESIVGMQCVLLQDTNGYWRPVGPVPVESATIG